MSGLQQRKRSSLIERTNFFRKKFAKNLHIRKKFVPLQLDTVNADVAQLARAADL